MSEPWLHIVGIGESGLSGLSPAAIALLENAQVIFGGDRHHKLAANISGERIAWPSPFDAMITQMKSHKGRRVVVLVSGDPLWYSVGARIGRAIDPAEICYHPQLSAFQYAACRMGWSLADLKTLTIHGRPAEQIIPWFYSGARLLILTKDHTSPATVARLLCDNGYENSQMSVLAAMGGEDEQRFDGIASDWADQADATATTGEKPGSVPETTKTFPDFHTLAVRCVAGPDARVLPKTGLPDDVFAHDGKITKQAIRALTLAKLAPQPGELLWDIGIGCGSVAIEWMRAADEARAIGIEPLAERRSLAAQNALRLGTPALQLVAGSAPDDLSGLKQPDAIFIGGGISQAVIDYALKALKPAGRLVANAVTLESEAVLLAAFEKTGGQLQRLGVSTAQRLGSFHGWKEAMPVTQWAITNSINKSPGKP